MATNILKKPGGASEIGAKLGSAAVSRNIEAALPSFPEVYIFLSNWLKVIFENLYIDTIVYKV